MPYSKGDVVFVNLGSAPTLTKQSKEIVGHEQGNERPCVVIKEFNKMELLIIVTVTTTAPKVPLYTLVKLPKGAGGLKYDSYAQCHQVRTISIDRVINTMGKLSDMDLGKIQATLIGIIS
jgi:mRNA interferase MazF